MLTRADQVIRPSKILQENGFFVLRTPCTTFTNTAGSYEYRVICNRPRSDFEVLYQDQVTKHFQDNPDPRKIYNFFVNGRFLRNMRDVVEHIKNNYDFKGSDQEIIELHCDFEFMKLWS